MDATSVATAGVQVEPGDPFARVFARFRLAQQLWFVQATLADLRATPAGKAALLQHYEREHTRLSRELGALQA